MVFELFDFNEIIYKTGFGFQLILMIVSEFIFWYTMHIYIYNMKYSLCNNKTVIVFFNFAFYHKLDGHDESEYCKV